MNAQFRPYSDDTRYGADYDMVRSFLLDLGDISYPFARWDWMISHSYLQPEGLRKTGLWEDTGVLVGLATFDTRLDGKCFLLVKEGYGNLYPEMIAYAAGSLSGGHPVQLFIRDGNIVLQAAARAAGYYPTQEKDSDAVLPLADSDLSYSLPDGFSITSLKETFDPFKYGQVMWKGFNHELKGEGPFQPTQAQLENLRLQFERPNVNPSLKIAVVAPNGDFVAYCGMWQDDATPDAIVEPVATDPAFRRMGLGRAAVLEAVRRCGELGAKRACVGSSQAFYYRIGFNPTLTATFWQKDAMEPENTSS